MSHKRDTRRTLTLGRRKEDVMKYEKLLTTEVPQTLNGKVYEDQAEWKKTVSRKLKLAQEEVEVLNNRSLSL